jgi:alpha/beta superfamily hydrolase
MTSAIETEQPITFYSKGQPALLLEGVVHTQQKAENAPLVILCHPQPASSNMNDPLLVTLARYLAEAGMTVLRFNFRGVGRSQGQQTDGRLEPLDLAGAIDAGLGQPAVNPNKVGVVGHAFGAYITLLYAPFDTRINMIVSISIPLFRASNGFPRHFKDPKLFVTGEFDEICPPFKLEPFVDSQIEKDLQTAKDLQIEEKVKTAGRVITGARHLMVGYEDEAANLILKYLKKWAEMPGV